MHTVLPTPTEKGTHPMFFGELHRGAMREQQRVKLREGIQSTEHEVLVSLLIAKIGKKVHVPFSLDTT